MQEFHKEQIKHNDEVDNWILANQRELEAFNRALEDGTYEMRSKLKFSEKDTICMFYSLSIFHSLS